MKKIMMVAGALIVIAAPAFAQEHKYQDVAPHANMSDFAATGQSPAQEDWNKTGGSKVGPGDAQKAERRAHMHEKMQNMTPEQKAQMHKRMEARREHMKNMTPEEKAAHKAKWEAKKKEWDAMTPEQKAAAKAKMHADRKVMDHKDH